MMPSYSDIQKLLNAADTSMLPLLRVSILRNIMVEPIEPYIRYFSLKLGHRAEVRLGEYDNIFQEAVGDSPSLLTAETDVVLIFTKLETLSPDLSCHFAGLGPPLIEAELERIEAQIKATLAGIRRQTAAMILWHGFEPPVYPALGVFDCNSDNGQSAIVLRLNLLLRQALQNIGSAYLVDMALCLSRLGAERFYDLRYWHLGKAPYSRDALQTIAMEEFTFIRALKGKNKKCLVLDCDGILWGGIVGEDGLSGIRLGKTYPGSAHFEFQQEVLNLFHRGVILALCSKNNEQDVWEVFDAHPDMALKRNHIAAAQINWRDKASNLRQIALDLNIGLDSMVFIDDSEFEIKLVRDVLPEVEALHFPSQSASSFRNMLAGCALFDTLTISEEDRRRGAMYLAEAGRLKLKAQLTDMEHYLLSLQMQVELGFADAFTIPRIAQLTQKTNQFNLTTRRHSESEIQDFSANPAYDVIWLRLSDSFGDSGIVGAAIIRYADDHAVFETFLLSCRVIGRGVEDLFLARLLDRAQARRAVRAVGQYLPTRKNSQVAGFYPAHGFAQASAQTDPGVLHYEFDLTTATWREPSYFSSVTFGAA